jgi:hypothetical protein
MSTGHPDDYGNAIMQKLGFFHRPADRRYLAVPNEGQGISSSGLGGISKPGRS